MSQGTTSYHTFSLIIYFTNRDRHVRDHMIFVFFVPKLWVRTALMARCTQYNIMW